MPYFIYRLQLSAKYRQKSNWNEDTEKIISEHFQYLKNNCDTGKLLLAGRTELDITDPFLFGITIFEAATMDEARKFADEDPAVKNEVMTSQLFPFSLALLRA